MEQLKLSWHTAGMQSMYVRRMHAIQTLLLHLPTMWEEERMQTIQPQAIGELRKPW